MTDDLRPPYRIAFDNARDPYSARNALGITSGGGGGAPPDAEYIVAVDDPDLTNDRVLTNTATVTWDFTTPGQAKANAAVGGGGNVSNVGTPTNGQFAQWTGATTIQGISAAAAVTALGTAKDAFHAHRNGSNLPGFVPAFSNCAFNFELFDQNSKYDTATQRWTPSAGLVSINANVTMIGLNAGSGLLIAIFKNGAVFKQSRSGTAVDGGTDAGANVTVIDLANGTDYYQCFAYVFAGSGTMMGTVEHSYFQGTQL